MLPHLFGRERTRDMERIFAALVGALDARTCRRSEREAAAGAGQITSQD